MNWRIELILRRNEVLFTGCIKENSTTGAVCGEPTLAITFKEIPAKNADNFPPETMDCMAECIRGCWPQVTNI